MTKIITNKTIVSACILSACGALVFNAFPVILTNIAIQFGFDEEQLGGLAMAYLGGFALVALLSPLWISRFNWRRCSVLSFALILVGVGAMLIVEAAYVDYCMVLFGVGSGVIFTIGLAVLSLAQDPDRAYGIKISTEMVFAGVVMLAITLFVVALFGFVGFVISLLLVYLFSAFSVVWLPEEPLDMTGSADVLNSNAEVQSAINWPALLASASLFVMFAALSSIWGFMMNIGVDAGVDAETVEILVSVSVLFGIVGASLCAIMGQRFGHLIPLLSAMTLIIVMLLLLRNETSAALFAFIVFAVNGLLQFLVVYQMGLVTEADLNGKYTVMIAFLLASGGAIGPEIFGGVIVDQGYDSAYNLAIVATLVAMALTLLTIKLLSLRQRT